MCTVGSETDTMSPAMRSRADGHSSGLRMNDRFVERLKHAIARGLEKRPQETEDEARRRREHMAQMNGESVVCTCGRAFHPTRSNQVYCSKRCRDARQR